MDKVAFYKEEIKKIAYSMNELVNETLSVTEDLPAFEEVKGSPFYEAKIKGKVREMVKNHPLSQEIVDGMSYNEARHQVKDPDNNRFGIGTGIGTLSGLALGALEGARQKNLVGGLVGGGFIGAGLGAAIGGIASGMKNEKYREQVVGPAYDTWGKEEELHDLVNQEIEDIKDNDLSPGERVQLAYSRMKEAQARAAAAERARRVAEMRAI